VSATRPLRERAPAGAARVARRVRLLLDGEPLEAREGETVASALLAAERVVLRRTRRRGEPRGAFCGMGVCFDCLIEIDGRPNLQACLVPVAEGMRIRTGDGEDRPE
jgi:predicted molibdopterin-dependent oxidoreductase YjgC